MQVKFITRGSKYNRTAISKNSFEAYLEDNKFLVLRIRDQISHSHVNITEGVTVCIPFSHTSAPKALVNIEDIKSASNAHTE